MRDDIPRTSKFDAAIRRRLSSIPGQATVVDVGTGPFALLAVMAARAGARKVYAIERNAAAAARAKDSVAELGLAAQIQVIEGDSTEVVLPERVDLVVSELIGSIATQEGVESAVRDARRRFLKEGRGEEGMIPARCQTRIAPVLYRGRSAWARLLAPREGLRSRGRPEPGATPPLRVRAAEEATFELLAAPQLLEDFDYAQPSGGPCQEERRLAFSVPSAAGRAARRFSGFAMWPRVVLDAEDALEVRGQPDSHWAYVIALMSPQPVPIATPGVIQLKSRADYATSPISYTLDAEVPV